MDKLDLMIKISNCIYDHIGYMYCDNCRYGSELECDEYGYCRCENCHRKYNGWALSQGAADYLATQIMKLMENHDAIE